MSKKLLSVLLAVSLIFTLGIQSTAVFADPDGGGTPPATNKYTVTWKDGNDVVIETDENVEEGSAPSYDGATPTKAADAQYTYTFNDIWNDGTTNYVTSALPSVTRNVTYTAQFTSAPIVPTEIKGDVTATIKYVINLTDGTLTLSGTGAIPAYTEITLSDSSKITDAPWANYAASIKKIVIGEKITKIGKNAFAFLNEVTDVELPSTLTESEDQAFKQQAKADTKIKYVNFGGTVDQWAMIKFGMKSSNPVYYADNLYIKGVLLEKANITSQYARQFTFCCAKALKEVTFGSAVEKIGKEAFRACTALTEVTFPINVVNIKAEAFKECESLKTATIKYFDCAIGDKGDKESEIRDIFPASTTTIAACPDTTAHKYAVKYNRTFKALSHSLVQSSVPATLYNDGKISSKCSECGATVTDKTINKISSVSVTNSVFTYNGGIKTPTVTVKDTAGKTLTEGIDYSLTYLSDRISVGEQIGYVSFINNYNGGSTFTYTIRPKKTAISKILGKSKKIYVKWKKRTVQTTGYQIQYATNKKFTSGKKTVKITKNTKLATNLKGLKKNKKYYVRVRTYHVVGGKTFYSDWSAVKSVKTK